jgi:hypothetical protein
MPFNHPSKTAARAHHLRQRYTAQNVDWLKLCDAYLPETSASIWRYSAANLEGPAQGWKLHISATILSAVEILRRVGPLLQQHEIPFKAPASLDELGRLNAGIYYGYSQVGKFITIYPRTEFEAKKLARELHDLTQGIVAPGVPFDRPYRSNSCVYYRYGSFIEQRVEYNGRSELAIQDPEGNLIPDRRDLPTLPSWTRDPFAAERCLDDHPKTPSLLTNRFKAFRALSQRGKGGVYGALDFSTNPPRLCVLKEGRRHGEVRIDGRDGYWRVQHEERVLKSLARKGVEVPSIYASFKAEKNYYVALEHIEGETLEAYLEQRQELLSLTELLQLSVALADLIIEIHSAGWVWRDCKPRNLILRNNGRLRGIDFEGASAIVNPDPLPWCTQSYSPPESVLPFDGRSRLPEDLYAVGKVIFLLAIGRLPQSDAETLRDSRSEVPQAVSNLVAALLHQEPDRRPAAKTVRETLLHELGSATQGSGLR